MNVLWIAIAGGVGAMLRYLITKKMKNIKDQYIPYATFLINIVGCFLIGFFYNYFSSQKAFFISVGFLGGFTTYSTFMYESFLLIQKGKWKQSVFYSLISFMVGIAFVFAGGIFGQAFVTYFK